MGANTMLEYSIEEASTLLSKNEHAAKEQIETLVKLHSKRVKIKTTLKTSEVENYTQNE